MALALTLRLVPALAAAGVIALTISLGNWQVGRARQKEVLQQRLEALRNEPPVDLGATPVDAQAIDLRQVEARGEWQPRFVVLHDNRVVRGVAGYHVLMPLKIEGSAMHVLVNRGWIAASPDRSRLPAVTTPAGVVSIAGMARVPSTKVFELAPERSTGPVWQNVTLPRYRAWSRLELQPIVIEQTSAAADGLVREWDRPDFGIDRHRGYAFQWYALAGLTGVLLVALSVKRRPVLTQD